MRHAVNTLLDSSLDTVSELNNVYHDGEWVVVELQNVDSLTSSEFFINHDKEADFMEATDSFDRSSTLESLQSNCLWCGKRRKSIPELDEVPTSTTNSSLSGTDSPRSDHTCQDKPPSFLTAIPPTPFCEGDASLKKAAKFFQVKESTPKTLQFEQFQESNFVDKKQASTDKGRECVCDALGTTLSTITNESSLQTIDEGPQVIPDVIAKQCIGPQGGETEERQPVRALCPKPEFPFSVGPYGRNVGVKAQATKNNKHSGSLISFFEHKHDKNTHVKKEKNAISMFVKNRSANLDMPLILRCAEGKGKSLERVAHKGRSVSLEPIKPPQTDASASHAQEFGGSRASIVTSAPAETGGSSSRKKLYCLRNQNSLQQTKIALVWAPNSTAKGWKFPGASRAFLPSVKNHRKEEKDSNTSAIGSNTSLDGKRGCGELVKTLSHDKGPSTVPCSGGALLNGDASPLPRESSAPLRDPQKSVRKLDVDMNSELLSAKDTPSVNLNPTTEERTATNSKGNLILQDKITLAIEALQAIRDSLREGGVREACGARAAPSLLQRIEDFLHQHEAEICGTGFSSSTRIHCAVSSFAEEKTPNLGALKAGEPPDVDEFDESTCCQDPYPHLETKFNYGKPTVFGRTTPFFKEGALYKIVTSNQEYHFYNDTLDKVMLVRAQCTLSEDERINDQAVVTPLADGSGETEIAISVLPEQTVFLMGVEQHAPRLMAKAVPAPDGIVAPSMAEYLDQVEAEIQRVRERLDRWSCLTHQEAYLRCCLKHQIGFVDLDFKPTAGSLCRAGGHSPRLPPLLWRRPRDFVALSELAELRLFRGAVGPASVRHGALPDHGVVGALAALAHRPSHLRWLLRHPAGPARGRKERAAGCHRVWLLRGGWWAGLVLDDYVPAAAGGPLFARCAADPREGWVGVLEKACAKAAGAYAALGATDALDALSALSGFPARPLGATWRAARGDPAGTLAGELFGCLTGCVGGGHVVLLRAPPAGERGEPALAEGGASAGRVASPFRPGHVYFVNGCAFYEELGLRVVRVRNVWARHPPYDPSANGAIPTAGQYADWCEEFDPTQLGEPAEGLPRDGDCLASSGAAPPPCGNEATGVEAAGEEVAQETVFLEWGEALRTFSGGGICYGLWNFSQYRIKNYFTLQGFPAFALEVATLDAVDIFLMLTMEDASEIGDDNSSLKAGSTTPHGVGILDEITLLITRRNQNEGTDSVLPQTGGGAECVVDSSVFGTSCHLCLKTKLEPNYSPYYIIPQLNTQKTCLLRQNSTPEEPLRFVLAIFSSKPVDPGVFDVKFQEVPPSCEVFCVDPPPSFHVSPSRVVKATYQCPNDRGVDTMERTCITPRGY